MSLTIYTKPDCPLCDKAHKRLKNTFPDLIVSKVDISSKSELYEQFRDKVPVFIWAGKEIGHWRPPIRKIQKLLRSL